MKNIILIVLLSKAQATEGFVAVEKAVANFERVR